MQDWSDRLLDERIGMALRFETRVLPQQKRAAWERLREKAREQAPLPATVVESRGSRHNEIGHWVMRATRTALIFVLDDTPYDRALEQRRNHWAMAMFDHPLRHAMGGLAG